MPPLKIALLNTAVTPVLPQDTLTYNDQYVSHFVLACYFIFYIIYVILFYTYAIFRVCAKYSYFKILSRAHDFLE